MGTRHPNPGLIKIHRSYRVDEIAECLSVCRATVRSWLKQGLPTIDDQRPAMVRGIDLRAFLRKRRQREKKTCLPGHLYCFRCRDCRPADGGMADYQVQERGAGNLTALCTSCGGWMKRRLGAAQLSEWKAILDITIRQPG